MSEPGVIGSRFCWMMRYWGPQKWDYPTILLAAYRLTAYSNQKLTAYSKFKNYSVSTIEIRCLSDACY